MMTVSLRTGDGVDVALYRLNAGAAPAGASARSVLLVHGALSSHTVWQQGGSRNTGLAILLATSGLDIWLAVWRSHGAVVGPCLDHPGLLLDAGAEAECWPLVARWIAAQPATARQATRTAS